MARARGGGWLAAVLLLGSVLSAPVPGAAQQVSPGPEPPPPVLVIPGVPSPAPLSPPETPAETPAPPPLTIPSVAPPVLAPAALPTAGRVEIHPILSLIEEYSDNFRRSGTHPESNWRTILSPGVDAGVNRTPTTGFVRYRFLPAYDTVTGDVGLFHLFTGQVSFQPTPFLRFTASDFFRRTDEPEEADILGLRQRRAPFISNVFSLVSNYRIGAIDTQAYYRFSMFLPESSGAGTGIQAVSNADTTTHALGASAATRLYQSNSLQLSYEYIRSETSGTTASTGSETTGHEFVATYMRQITERTAAGVTGGYAFHDVTRRHMQDESFDVADVKVFTSYVLPKRWSLQGNVGVSRLTQTGGHENLQVSTSSTLSYSWARALASVTVVRGFSETFQTGQNFGVVETQGVTATLFYPFTPKITGTATAIYRENTLTGAGGPSRNSTNEVVGGSVDVQMLLTRSLTLGLRYGHTEASGLLGEPRFVENRVRLSLGSSF